MNESGESREGLIAETIEITEKGPGDISNSPIISLYFFFHVTDLTTPLHLLIHEHF
ncbi:hypothetical protein RZN22_10335 [Bacillaceae bacterium S4-13-58]